MDVLRTLLVASALLAGCTVPGQATSLVAPEEVQALEVRVLAEAAAIRANPACRPGSDPFDPQLKPVLDAARADAARARALLDAGKTAEALIVALDHVAILQEFERCHSSLLGAMLGAAAFEHIAEVLRVAMELDIGADLTTLHRSIETLLSRELPVSTVFANEARFGAVQAVLEGLEQAAAGPVTGELLTGDPRAELVLVWDSFQVVSQELQLACPPGATPAACAAALTAQSEREAPGVGIADWASIAFSAEPARAARDRAVRVLVDVARPNYGRYVERLIARRELLAALLAGSAGQGETRR